MAFNLNQSKKPEVELNRTLIDEVISIYGLPVKYLFVEKMNKNQVFKDFSHFELNPNVESKQIYLLPEDTSDWEGDTVFNQFGFYNQWTQHLFMSRKTALELYPNFDENGRAEMTNNLIITPSNTILEITQIETYEPGVNNLWGFGDESSVYKIAVKIYDHNISDEIDLTDSIKLSEDGYRNGGDKDDIIFSDAENIDTTDIDDFFNELQKDIDETEEIADKGDDKGNKPSNTNSPFGNLS